MGAGTFVGRNTYFSNTLNNNSQSNGQRPYNLMKIKQKKYVSFILNNVICHEHNNFYLRLHKFLMEYSSFSSKIFFYPSWLCSSMNSPLLISLFSPAKTFIRMLILLTIRAGFAIKRSDYSCQWLSYEIHFYINRAQIMFSNE